MRIVFDKHAKEMIWDQLRSIALVDGELSKDEQELIVTIISDIEKYNHTLENALKDGIIDEKEEKRLFEGRMNVMERAYAKAREDFVISDDEKEILKEICRIVRDIN